MLNEYFCSVSSLNSHIVSEFHLPGKKKLIESDVEWDVVLVDVSEHAIEARAHS